MYHGQLPSRAIYPGGDTESLDYVGCLDSISERRTEKSEVTPIELVICHQIPVGLNCPEGPIKS